MHYVQLVNVLDYVNVEEVYLISVFGDEYLEYKKSQQIHRKKIFFSYKSIDKYPQNSYDIRVCRIVRYKYVHL